jgi:hypothetical protein
VYAIETTEAWRNAARLVRENGLEAVVEVIPTPLSELAPRDVDLAFIEPPMVQPFSAGLLESGEAIQAWLAPGGTFAPVQVAVWLAPIRAALGARNARSALSRARRIASQFDLGIGVLESDIQRFAVLDEHPIDEAPIGPPVQVCAVPIGTPARPESQEVWLTVREAGPVGGVVLGYELDFGDGVAYDGRPTVSAPNRTAVVVWCREVDADPEHPIRVLVRFQDGRISVSPP